MSRNNGATRPWHGAMTACLVLGILLVGAPLGGQDRSGPLIIGSGVTVAYSFPIAGKFGLVCHPDDEELRKEVESALECMKLDGTLTGLHWRWFGFPAGEDTATNTVYMGYCHPGYEGHDPEPHVPPCS